MIRISIVLAIILTTGSVQAEQKNDGNWWRDQLNDSLRTGYVFGYLQGLQTAGLVMPSATCTAMGVSPKMCNDVGWKAYNDAFGNYIRPTSGQFLEGVNLFYQDYRNRQIAVIGAMHYVSRAIAGASAADLEKLVEAQRQATR